jgi:hypothetical protein
MLITKILLGVLFVLSFIVLLIGVLSSGKKATFKECIPLFLLAVMVILSFFIFIEWETDMKKIKLQVAKETLDKVIDAYRNDKIESNKEFLDITKNYTTYDRILKFNKDTFYVVKLNGKYVQSITMDIIEQVHIGTTDDIKCACFFIGDNHFPNNFYYSLPKYMTQDGVVWEIYRVDFDVKLNINKMFTDEKIVIKDKKT